MHWKSVDVDSSWFGYGGMNQMIELYGIDYLDSNWIQLVASEMIHYQAVIFFPVLSWSS